MKMKHKDDLYRGGFWSASERLAELERKVLLMQLQINDMEAKLTSNPWTRDSFRPSQSLDIMWNGPIAKKKDS